MTGTMEGTGPDGTLMKTKETTEWKDDGTRVFTMYGPDGTTPMMRISYKRRK
jgi:histidyl-tRNA synthetase